MKNYVRFKHCNVKVKLRTAGTSCWCVRRSRLVDSNSVIYTFEGLKQVLVDFDKRKDCLCMLQYGDTTAVFRYIYIYISVVMILQYTLKHSNHFNIS